MQQNTVRHTHLVKLKVTSEAKTPRYLTIADALLHDIRTGKLTVGRLLPREDKLCAKFDVSRGTMRQALGVLEDAGLILRRQRTGTRILSRFPARGLVDNDQLLEDWSRYGSVYPLKISSITGGRPPVELMRDERFRPTEQWLAITGLRYAVGSRKPSSYCEVYIHPDFSGIRGELGSTPSPIFALIEQRYGRVIAGIRMELHGVVLTRNIAAKVGGKTGAPALQMIRYFLDANRQTVELAINIHPADRFTYNVEIARSRSDSLQPPRPARGKRQHLLG